MIALNTYALSDSVATLRRWLSEYDHSGVTLDGQAVTALVGELKEIQMAARRMENTLSRHEWNERARNESRSQQGRAQALVEALQLPNTTVALFPVVPRQRPAERTNGR